MISINNSTAPKAPPKSFTCYLCQRAYGSASIGIHVKSCRATFLATEASKPLKERRAVPEEHADYSAAASWTAAEAEAANAIAAQRGNEMLDACDWCGRTFNPDRLMIHQRSCTKEKPAKAITGFRSASGDTPLAGAGGGGGIDAQVSSPQPSRRSKSLSVTGPTNGSIASPLRSSLRPPPRTASITTTVALSAAATVGEAAWAAAIEEKWVKEQKNSNNNHGLTARVALLASRLSSLQSYVNAEFSLLTAEALSLAKALENDEDEKE